MSNQMVPKEVVNAVFEIHRILSILYNLEAK